MAKKIELPMNVAVLMEKFTDALDSLDIAQAAASKQAEIAGPINKNLKQKRESFLDTVRAIYAASKNNDMFLGIMSILLTRRFYGTQSNCRKRNTWRKIMSRGVELGGQVLRTKEMPRRAWVETDVVKLYFEELTEESELDKVKKSIETLNNADINNLILHCREVYKQRENDITEYNALLQAMADMTQSEVVTRDSVVNPVPAVVNG